MEEMGWILLGPLGVASFLWLFSRVMGTTFLKHVHYFMLTLLLNDTAIALGNKSRFWKIYRDSDHFQEYKIQCHGIMEKCKELALIVETLAERTKTLRWERFVVMHIIIEQLQDVVPKIHDSCEVVTRLDGAVFAPTQPLKPLSREFYNPVPATLQFRGDERFSFIDDEYEKIYINWIKIRSAYGLLYKYLEYLQKADLVVVCAPQEEESV